MEFKDPNILHEFTLTVTPGKKVKSFVYYLILLLLNHSFCFCGGAVV